VIGPRGFERISIGGMGRLGCTGSGGLVVEDDDNLGKVGRYENRSPFTRFPIVDDDGTSEECDTSLTSDCEEKVSCSGDRVDDHRSLIAIVDETSSEDCDACSNCGEKVSCSGDGVRAVDPSWLIAIASSRRCEYLGANNVGGITMGS
jgi:hypothetical protein